MKTQYREELAAVLETVRQKNRQLEKSDGDHKSGSKAGKRSAEIVTDYDRKVEQKIKNDSS